MRAFIIQMMKKFWTHRFIVILIAALVPFMVAAQETCDESCSVGGGTEPTFKVVSPVGRQTVEMIDMAPRLNTLEGKPSRWWAAPSWPA